MKYSILLFLTSFFFAQYCSCADGDLLLFQNRHLEKTYGDTQKDGVPLAKIAIEYPFFSGRSEETVNSVNTYVMNYLITELSKYLPGGQKGAADLEQVSEMFLDGYADFHNAFPDSPQRWSLELNGAVVYAAPVIVTIRIELTAYTGGAHSNYRATYHCFSVISGKKLALEDIITDEQELTSRAEKKFRAMKNLREADSLKDAGFWFDSDTFALNDNFGVTETGLLFFYNPYEIAPWAMGSTELAIPFEEIRTLLKE